MIRDGNRNSETLSEKQGHRVTKAETQAKHRLDMFHLRCLDVLILLQVLLLSV
jgi:hypothetical protein